MILCLFEDPDTEHLRPLVDLRPSYDIRTGIRTNLGRASEVFPNARIVLHMRSILVEAGLERYGRPVNRIAEGVDVLFVNGRALLTPGPGLEAIEALAASGERRMIVRDGAVVAAFWPSFDGLLHGEYLESDFFSEFEEVESPEVAMVSRVWHVLNHLHEMIESDFARITKGYNILDKPDANIHTTAILANDENIFVGRGARILPGAILHAETGPIYIDDNALVMEHAVLRGPLYLGPYSQAKVNAQIDGSSLGPWVKMGGEVHDVIVHSYSNKAHLGFLGDAYIGQWCNFGAASNNSNLRNDYGETSLMNLATGTFEPTGRQFLGLFMGDHSKCAIGTHFNTASVIGTYVNLFGEGFQPRCVSSFEWGGQASGFERYRIDKALHVARAVMRRRDVVLSEAEEALLRAEYLRVTGEDNGF
jgi:UDP-N-acetylglucosamine diphosphorylase / glucose-1-phosphate thymidylyltransferase / UDP-N-acetylgalactosamine diphosphorylase / glucosamine-1-phosphate N-acetyltransferase / galactosamine-1-phosphate N-acetyltransferase